MMMERLTLRRFGANSHDFLSNGRPKTGAGEGGWAIGHIFVSITIASR
jgi:hypothetical protein